MGIAVRSVLNIARLPVDDYLAALDVAVRPPRAAVFAAIAVAGVVSWWIYVPIHELLHAAGCLLGGGEVTRLEIDPMYGAAWLQRWFPFVAVGSDYAGQLTGFDTRGSDLTYLLTDFLPFVLTIVIGVPLLRAAARQDDQMGSALRLGAALPIAFAPFISLPGDYYEMGSILATRAAALFSPGFDLQRWRSDDIFRLIEQLRASGTATVSDVVGVGAALLIGAVLAFATYAAGTLCARAWFRAGRSI